MNSTSQTKRALIRRPQEIQSIWVISVLRWQGITYQAHMSLFLVLIWLTYESYQASQSLAVALQPAATLILVLVAYESLRLSISRASGLLYDQVTLYPFVGVSSATRQKLSTLISNLYQQTKPDDTNLKIIKNIERAIRLECIPGLMLIIIAIGIYFVTITQPDAGLELLFYATSIIAASTFIPVTPFPGAYLLLTASKNWWLRRHTLSNTAWKILIIITVLSTSLWTESITLTIIVFSYSFVVIEQHLFEKTKQLAANHMVKQAMLPASELKNLQHGQSVDSALETIRLSFQPIFPVYHAHELVGFVHRGQLLRSIGPLQEIGIAEIADRSFIIVEPESNLGDALGIFHTSGREYIAVCKGPLGREFLGLLTKDKVLEYILMQSAAEIDPWSNASDEDNH